MVCWSRMPLKIWRILQPSPRKMHRTLHTISQGSWIPRIIHENPFLDGEALTFSNYKKIYWPRKNGAWHNPPTIKSESIGLFNKLVRLAVLFLQLHSLGFLVPTEDRLESSKAFLLLFLSSPPGFPFLHHHFQCWLLIISLLCLKHFNDLPSPTGQSPSSPACFQGHPSSSTHLAHIPSLFLGLATQKSTSCLFLMPDVFADPSMFPLSPWASFPLSGHKSVFNCSLVGWSSPQNNEIPRATSLFYHQCLLHGSHSVNVWGKGRKDLLNTPIICSNNTRSPWKSIPAEYHQATGW